MCPCVHVHVCRELPGSEFEVWFESTDGSYRWRQTARSVLLQLLALPDHITGAKQLSVSIEPYTLRVHQRALPLTGEGHQVFPFRGESDVPAGSDPQPPGQALGGQVGLNPAQGRGGIRGAEAAGQVCQLGELLFEAQLVRAIVPEDSTWVFVRPEQQRRAAAAAASGGGSSAAAVSTALVPSANGGSNSSSSSSSSSSGCYILFELTKMNLELYER
jgi:hypothetical protein